MGRPKGCYSATYSRATGRRTNSATAGATAGVEEEGEEYEYVCDVTDEKIDVAREGRYHYAM